MNDVFEYIIKPYLETKECGWSPFELHIVQNRFSIGTIIDNETFESYRCLVKKSFENGNNRYYDVAPDRDDNDEIHATQPRLMKLKNVYSNYSGMTSFGSMNGFCHIIIVNRTTKKVILCSGALHPLRDRNMYMKQFSNMFKKFDSMIIESNIENVIKKRFEN